MAARSLFFRVDGADQETGDETYLVLQAGSKPEAEKLARSQGLLISSIRVAKPGDWGREPIRRELVIEVPIEPPSAAEPSEDLRVESEAKPEQTAKETPAEVALPEPSVQPVTAEPVIASVPTRRTNVGVLVAAGIAGALELAGLLTLVLALIPDGRIRNDLQAMDLHIRVLIRVVLGCTMILGGLILFAVAAVAQLCMPRSYAPTA